MTPGTVQRARCRIGGLIFLLAAAPAGAQEAIIVTGSRTGPDETSTAVVTAEDIERTQPVTALEPLDRVAGVRAFSKVGLFYLSVRGGEPNFTLVLPLGIRVTAPSNSRRGASACGQHDPFPVERAAGSRT